MNHQGSSLHNSRYVYVPKNESSFFQETSESIGPYPTLLNTLEKLRQIISGPGESVTSVLGDVIKHLGAAGAVLGGGLSLVGAGALVAAVVSAAVSKLDDDKESRTVEAPAKAPVTPEGAHLPPARVATKHARWSPSVNEAIHRAAIAMGEKESDLRTIIDIESKGDPLAGEYGDYEGLGQFSASTWNQVSSMAGGLPPTTRGSDDPRLDPYLNAKATAAYMKINRRTLQKNGIPNPTLPQLYMAHNIGPTAALEVIRKPSSEWSRKTIGHIKHQAAELQIGGPRKYEQDVIAAMRRHSLVANAAENTNTEQTQVAVDKSMVKPVGYSASVPISIPSYTPVAPKALTPVGSTEMPTVYVPNQVSSPQIRRMPQDIVLSPGGVPISVP